MLTPNGSIFSIWFENDLDSNKRWCSHQITKFRVLASQTIVSINSTFNTPNSKDHSTFGSTHYGHPQSQDMIETYSLNVRDFPSHSLVSGYGIKEKTSHQLSTLLTKMERMARQSLKMNCHAQFFVKSSTMSIAASHPNLHCPQTIGRPKLSTQFLYSLLESENLNHTCTTHSNEDNSQMIKASHRQLH